MASTSASCLPMTSTIFGVGATCSVATSAQKSSSIGSTSRENICSLYEYSAACLYSFPLRSPNSVSWKASSGLSTGIGGCENVGFGRELIAWPRSVT